MKKNTNLFLGMLAASTLSLTSCGATTNTSPATYVSGNSDGTLSLGLSKEEQKTLLSSVPRGNFRVGVIGHDFSKSLEGKELAGVINSYTQHLKNSEQTGIHFLGLPTGLYLRRLPENFNRDKTWIDPENKAIIKSSHLEFLSFIEKSTSYSFSDAKSLNSTNGNGGYLMVIPDGWKDQLLKNQDGTPSKFLQGLYKNLPNKRFTSAEYLAAVKKALSESGFDKYWSVNNDLIDANTYANPKAQTPPSTPKREILVISNENVSGYNAANQANFDVAYTNKNNDFNSFKSIIGKSEIDKTLNIKKYNLKSLLIQVKDGVHNSSSFYKSLVEKKEFDKTKIFMVGKKSKSQTGSSSKVFAGKNISTGTFDDYASAYMAGFQAAASQLTYSTEEKSFEETNVSFFIGSINDGKSKKRAFAFRRGVEAAASHPWYSAYLKVKFVSKTADSRSTGKKLFYDVSDWKDDNKIAEFTSSDDFQDSDRKIVYIAGTTARDWRGHSNAGTNVNGWDSGDDFGLIGAIYKYGSTGRAGVSIGKKINVVLDNLEAFAKDGSKDALEDVTLVSGAKDVDMFERDGIRLLGTLGDESYGTKVYSELTLQAMYGMTNIKYMLGKHTTFGAPLDIRYSSIDNNNLMLSFNKFDIERFLNSIRAGYSKETTISQITASSPWMK